MAIRERLNTTTLDDIGSPPGWALYFFPTRPMSRIVRGYTFISSEEPVGEQVMVNDVAVSRTETLRFLSQN